MPKSPRMNLDAPPTVRQEEIEMITTAMRYARYTLAALSSVGFGLSSN
jgi:hypothetical protein